MVTKADVDKPLMMGLEVTIRMPEEVRWYLPFSMGEPSWLAIPTQGGRPVLYYVSPMKQWIDWYSAWVKITNK